MSAIWLTIREFLTSKKFIVAVAGLIVTALAKLHFEVPESLVQEFVGILIARLVIEAIDLDRHRLDVLREREHRDERLVVEKLQTRHWIARHIKRRRTPQRITPQTKARHRRVIRPHKKSRRLERANDAPVRIACEHRRRRLH